MFPFLKKKDAVTLGGKHVEVPKLTRNRLKKLIDHVGTIGSLLVKLFLTPEADRAVFIVAAMDVTIDEVYELTSLLSDIPIEHLNDKASFAECTEYLKLTWERNDMNAALGNLNGLIPSMAQQFVQSVARGLSQAVN